MKKAARAKGTRDFIPAVMRKRQYVIDTIRSVFERYGYSPMETPAVERWDVLKGKLGEEGEQLLFQILRRGTSLEDLRLGKTDQASFSDFDDVVDLALRYDLTVPFSRVLAMHANDLAKPFKRYQIQPVWRADRPQKGRYREFYQCDVDIAGSESMVADAEIVAITHDALVTLGFQQFDIRLNHRLLLNGLVATSGGADLFGPICIAIDKLDKIGKEGVEAELLRRGVSEETAASILNWIDIKGHPDQLIPQLTEMIGDNKEGQRGLAELQELYAALGYLGVNIDHVPLDLSLVRGLDYYTGPIFETAVTEPKIGSLSGGGRYDDLIEKFSGQSMPAVGGTIGLERIIDVMDELDMFPDLSASSDLLVTIFQPESLGDSLAFAQMMRKEGISTEVYLKPNTKLKRQFDYAGKQNIPVIAILGPDEVAEEQVTLRINRNNQKVPFAEAAGLIKEALAADEPTS